MEHLRQLRADEQFNYSIEEGRQVDLFSPDVSLAQAQRFLQVYKSNVEASRCYKPYTYHGKIILFRATKGVAVEESLEPDFGWKDYASEGVEIIRVPGNHLNMVKSPHVQVLTEQLKIYIQTS